MTLSLGGLGIVALAATLNGVFTVPLKFMSGWEWENAWLVYTLVGTIVLPWILVAASIPHVVEVYAGAPLSEIGMAAGFGFAWGVGGVLFGVCVTLVGNALTFAVVLGLTSCIGSLAPFIIDHPDELGSTQGILNYVALAIVIVSLAVISVAGTFKDKQQQRVAKVQAAVAGDVAPLAEALLERGDDASDVSTPAANGGKTMLGLVLCVVSGLLSPMLNFPLAFCTEIPARARSLNASKVRARPVVSIELRAPPRSTSYLGSTRGLTTHRVAPCTSPPPRSSWRPTQCGPSPSSLAWSPTPPTPSSFSLREGRGATSAARARRSSVTTGASRTAHLPQKPRGPSSRSTSATTPSPLSWAAAGSPPTSATP